MKKVVTLVFLCTGMLISSGQESDPWSLGIGVNIVDNSGSRFDELLNIKENWNISRLLKATIEKRFEYDFGVEISFSMNSFTRGKVINSVVNQEKVNYFAVDVMVKNYFSNYLEDARHAKFALYIVGGWGGNFFNATINETLNIGIGLNIKLGTYLWLNFQTLGKFSIDENTPGNANHLQHSTSVIFWL
ncbi:hypothetical protein F0000_17595 [Aquimarina sp. RZ0]|nr:hypothetical protein F0000_17595 [Aquimarina sp. RZ0]